MKVNLTDNWLGREGGDRICDMLKENCYISEIVSIPFICTWHQTDHLSHTY